MHRRARAPPSPAFMQAAKQTGGREGQVSEAVLRQARRSGQLNLSMRGLETVPLSVWRLNMDPPAQQSVSFDASKEERWWDQTDLLKLILADNRLSELSEDLQLLPALTVLDVHDNQLVRLPHALGELHSLTRLVLSHNLLPSLVVELCSLSSLQQLKVDHNQLSELPADMGCLTGLEELDVSNNRLTSLPPSLAGMTGLHHLAASHNQITEVPEGIGTLRGLTELSLNNNKLASLPPFTAAEKLQVLDLHYNLLTEMPDIRPGAELKELRLGSNRLAELRVERLCQLVSLQFLDLRENRINSLPEEMAQLKKLERLDLCNNDLSALPYVMGYMPHLKSLLLDGNPLRGLRRDIVQRGTTAVMKHLRSRIEPPEEHPPHITTKHTPSKKPSHRPAEGTESPSGQRTRDVSRLAEKTRELDLSKQSLALLPPEVFSHAQLVGLNAGYNKLTAVPPEIAQLKALTVLDLRGNQLVGLPQELEACSKLRDVVLSYNRLREIPPVLYRLNKLENIIASDNQIESIMVEELLRLPLLACLDLQNNSITHVPPQLGNITSLRHLQLSGNPFRIPRASVLARGTPALLDYLRDRIPT